MYIPDEQLEVLYTDAFPQAAKFVGKMGGDLDTAKDLFHDALIIFIEKKQDKSFVQTGSPSAYLVGITKMLWYQHLRNERLTSSSMDASGSSTDDSFEQESEEEQTQNLHNHLKLAGPKCLDLLTAFYYDKKSLEEIAEELNYKNVRSATVQKYKCIEKLRGQMKKSFVHEAAA